MINVCLSLQMKIFTFHEIFNRPLVCCIHLAMVRSVVDKKSQQNKTTKPIYRLKDTIPLLKKYAAT